MKLENFFQVLWFGVVLTQDLEMFLMLASKALLGSSAPPASTSQVIGNTGPCHHIWFLLISEMIHSLLTTTL